MSDVLIIEDDPILRSAYVTVLTIEGFDVRDAPDGKTGLKLAAEREPDVILLDMLMPNLGGLEFMRAYKPKENELKVKVIVFSNISVPEQMKEVLDLGAARYLTKSKFTPKEMVEAIKGVL